MHKYNRSPDNSRYPALTRIAGSFLLLLAISGCKLSEAESPDTLKGIVIKGDEKCLADNLAALSLLQVKAPTHFQVVNENIGVIECVTFPSGMYAQEMPKRFAVGVEPRSQGTIWLAGTMAHDAVHALLYQNYQDAHPGMEVPRGAWGGRPAEVICLAAQADALTQIGATPEMIEYVRQVIDTEYYDVPLEDRWW